MTNLESLDAAQLSALIERAVALREKRLVEARKSFRSEVAMKARELGVSIDDLLNEEAPRVGRPRGRPAKAKPAGKASGAVRGPNGEVWSGRGRKPGWLHQMEAGEAPAKAARRGRPAKESRKGRALGPAPVKFRGPNGETWAGRGRPPRWLTALEAKGERRDRFAV
jgi:DNA-binding protein H-NS